jgi:hypothetical protein
MAESLSFPGTMTDAIILHAPLRRPLSCPSWQEPLLHALPCAHRLERYELQAGDLVPGVVGHVVARTHLTLIVESLELDDTRLSALLERSFGLAAQFE